MNKATTLQLSIPSPCSENWEQMTPDTQGRFCAHCQKSVIDFTGWTDAMLFDFFSRQKNTNVCGRLLNTQLNRPIHLPPQPHSKLYRMAIALGLTLLIAQAQPAPARPLPPLTAQNLLTTTHPQNDTTTNTDSITIKGQVTDEKHEPLIGVNVLIRNEQSMVIAGTLTDIDGNYQIRLPANSDCRQITLTATYMVYKDVTRQLSYTSDTCNMQMKTADLRTFISSGLLVPYTASGLKHPDAGRPNNTIIGGKDLHHMGY